MSIRTLKTLARQAATAHGHTLTRFHATKTGYHFAQCSQCSAYMTVTLYPCPNDPQISGEAIALHCKGSA